jgi:DNA replication licensing factor MCM6
LRQSIIHVEQDDINFDEDEELNGVANGHDIDGDAEMDAADIAALDAAESSLAKLSSSTQPTGTPTPAPPSDKKKMRITCE